MLISNAIQAQFMYVSHTHIYIYIHMCVCVHTYSMRWEWIWNGLSYKPVRKKISFLADVCVINFGLWLYGAGKWMHIIKLYSTFAMSFGLLSMKTLWTSTNTFGWEFTVVIIMLHALSCYIEPWFIVFIVYNVYLNTFISYILLIVQ